MKDSDFRQGLVSVIIPSLVIFVIAFFLIDLRWWNVIRLQVDCSENQVVFEWSCYDKKVSCVVEHWSWEKIWEWWSYSVCVPTVCDKRYKKEGSSCVINIPSEPRKYIDYMMTNGVTWEDFVIITPVDWLNITSPSSDVNNERMYDYLYSNQKEHQVSIPNWVKEWYIMITTKEEIWYWANDKLFLWVDEKITGIVDRSKSYTPYAPNEYIFDMTSVPQLTNWWQRSYITNILNYANNGKVSVVWIVSPSWNSVEKITIVFKQYD